MPKIAAKSGEIIDATTSPVDNMNLDRSPPIHCPFFVKGFLFLHCWFGRRVVTFANKHTTVFLMMHLGERNSLYFVKKLLKTISYEAVWTSRDHFNQV